MYSMPLPQLSMPEFSQGLPDSHTRRLSYRGRNALALWEEQFRNQSVKSMKPDEMHPLVLRELAAVNGRPFSTSFNRA